MTLKEAKKENGLTHEQYQTRVDLAKTGCELNGADEVRIEKTRDDTYAVYAVTREEIGEISFEGADNG